MTSARRAAYRRLALAVLAPTGADVDAIFAAAAESSRDLGAAVKIQRGNRGRLTER
jgi:hypothetical protein